MNTGFRQFGAHSEVDWRSLAGGVREVAPSLFGAASASAAGEHPCKAGGDCKCGGSCGGPSAGAKAREPFAVWQPPFSESLAPALDCGTSDFRATIMLPEWGLRPQAPSQGVVASRAAGTPSAEHVARNAVIENLTQVLATPDLNAKTRQAIVHALMLLPQRWSEVWSGRAGPDSSRIAKAVLGGTDSPPGPRDFVPMAPHGGQQDTTEEFVRNGGFTNWANFRLALQLLSLADASWHRSGNVFAILLLALLFALADLAKNCGGKLVKIGQSCAGKKANCCEPPLVCSISGNCNCPAFGPGAGCSDDCPCPSGTDCMDGICSACVAPTEPGQKYTEGCGCPPGTKQDPSTQKCICDPGTYVDHPCHPQCGCEPPYVCGKDSSGKFACLCPDCKTKLGDPCGFKFQVPGCEKCDCPYPYSCDNGKCGCPKNGLGCNGDYGCPKCPEGQSCTTFCDVGGNWKVCDVHQAAQYQKTGDLGKGGVACGCGNTNTPCICDALKVAKPEDLNLTFEDSAKFTAVKALCK